MRQPRSTIWIERALLVLFLASLAGTLNLVMAVHRRTATTRNATEAVSAQPVPLDAPTVGVPAEEPKPLAVATPTVLPAPSPPKAPAPPPEDPTKKALTELEAAVVQEIAAARQADRKAETLEKARLNAVAESRALATARNAGQTAGFGLG